MRDDALAIQVERRIYLLRGEKVLLDHDLAALYGVPVKVLNQAVRRNINRFPSDFLFQLNQAETKALRSQIVTLDDAENRTATGKRGKHSKYLSYAFTEQGVAMLSSVLRSPRAVQVNIAIMRTFVRLRQMLLSNAELARKLNALEKKYDAQFKIVFDAMRELMMPPEKPKRRIGFHS
jgi:hypothetical protein